MTRTPAVRIEMEGSDVTANLVPAPWGLPLATGGVAVTALGVGKSILLSLTVSDAEGTKSDSCEIEVDNRERHRAPKKGSSVKVWLGYVETGIKYMGSYKVEGWTKSGGVRKMTINCKAADMTSDIKGQKSRSYHDMTAGEIVEKVAGKNSLTAQVHSEIAKVKIGHIDQSNESDLNFLTRLAKRVGASFKIADGTVIFNKAGSGDLPGGGSAPDFTFRESDVSDWSASGSERGAFGCAEARWLDKDTGERDKVTKGEGKPVHRDRKLYPTKDEAEVACEAQLSALNRGKVSLSINLPGDVDIFAGASATVAFDDEDVDGAFSIKTASHTLGGDGLKTSLTCESKADADGGSSDDGDKGGDD